MNKMGQKMANKINDLMEEMRGIREDLGRAKETCICSEELK